MACNREHFNDRWYRLADASEYMGALAARLGLDLKDERRPRGEFNPYWKLGYYREKGITENPFKH
jgi:hypothetical protein